MCASLFSELLGTCTTNTKRGTSTPQLNVPDSAIRPRSMRPLVVGIVHGLAGSAAITLLVLGTTRNALWATCHRLVFGVGTVAGMLFITMAMALPVAAIARRFERLHRMLGRSPLPETERLMSGTRMVDSRAHMKDSLVRFGVAMESGLIEQLDAIAAVRGCNRSELLRDLVRAEVSRSAVADRVPAFAALTLVYNHHVRELSEHLTAVQHDLGERVRATMHVHLDHEHCLEVIVMRGRSDELIHAADRMIGTRGVLQGGAEYVAETTLAMSGSGRRVHHEHPHAPARAATGKDAVAKVLRRPKKRARKAR